jgi:DNA-binding transcriptional regulator YbjK
VSLAQTQLPDRRAAIADAALAVLEADGGRGLTHRAVDRRAGLPQGSTSNYFSTREALLTAALDRVVELERPAVEALEALVPGGPYDPREAAELLANFLEALVTPPRSRPNVARFELELEARRRPEFQRALNRVRGDYLRITERLLPSGGCTRPRDHAPQLLVLLDGLMLNQLFEPASALPREAVVEQFERFFTSC